MQELTLEMMEQLLNGTSPMADLYDEIRLVEPEYGMVCNIENGKLVVTDKAGWMRWHRCEPRKQSLVRLVCNTCRRMVRFEYAENCYYFVVAQPVTVDGRDCALELITDITGRVVTDEGIAERESFVHDISRHLEDISEHDATTGLYDRAFAARAVEARLKRAQGPLYLGLFDLDGFKYINDYYGHVQGDTVLIKFSELLRAEAAGHGYAARLHGDKFVIVFDSADEAECAASMERIAENLRTYQFHVEERIFCITTSYGLADISKAGYFEQGLALARQKLDAQREEAGICI